MHSNSEVQQPLQTAFSFNWWEFPSRATIQVPHTSFFTADDLVCSVARLSTSMYYATLTADFTSSNAGDGCLPSASYQLYLFVILSNVHEFFLLKGDTECLILPLLSLIKGNLDVIRPTCKIMTSLHSSDTKVFFSLNEIKIVTQHQNCSLQLKFNL